MEVKTPFEVQPYDLEVIGRRGGSSICATVHGYWSRDPVSVRIERKIDWSALREGNDKGEWTASFSHSSGGRDTKVEADDLVAAGNFAMAMIALCSTARAVLAQQSILEAAFQARRAEVAAEHEAERAAKQAKIDADPALGTEAAEALVAAAKARAKATRRDVLINVYARGSEESYQAVASYGHGSGAVTFSHKGWMSGAKFVACLADKSARTAIITPTEA